MITTITGSSVLTFISTIATPLFCGGGYLIRSHGTMRSGKWVKSKRGYRLPLFWMTVYYLCGTLTSVVILSSRGLFCLHCDLHLSSAYQVAQPATRFYFSAWFFAAVALI